MLWGLRDPDAITTAVAGYHRRMAADARSRYSTDMIDPIPTLDTDDTI